MASQSEQKEPPYWSHFSDLYGPLTSSEIPVLEKAVRARKLGRLHEARAIWDHELPPSHLVPVLALERAELEGRFGFEQSRFQVLDAALTAQAEWRERPMGREVELLTVLRSEARFTAQGMLYQALQSARRLRETLECVSLDDWTDIEVSKRQWPP